MATAHTKLISQDFSNVLSLAEAKAHLRIPEEDVDQDEVITAAMQSAISYAESRTERIFSDTVYQLRIAPLDNTFALPYPDFNAITKVEAIIPDQANQVLFNTVGSVGTLSDYLAVDDWVVPAELTMTTDALPTGTTYLLITISFGTGASTPKDVLNGIKMMCAHFYDNIREVEVGRTANQVPMGAEMLFSLNRFYRFG